MNAGIWIAAGLLAVSAIGAQAHESQTQLCDYALGYDLAVAPGDVRLSSPAEHWRIDGDRLYRNDREQALTQDERRQLARYREAVERLVPTVSALAVEGAMLGVEAVTLTLALLGDDEDVDALSARLAKLSERLRAQFDGRRLPAGGIDDQVLDAKLEAEIEDIASDAALQLTGSISRFVFSAIFNPSEAEARGAHIERVVERRIEPRAEAIERRAEALCDELRTLDAQERALNRFDLLIATEPEV